MAACAICGKQLTDAKSIELGIGPKCLGGIHSANPELIIRMDDMFGGKPDFTYRAVRGVIIITDLNKGGMAVTEGIESVLGQIKIDKPKLCLSAVPILYYDSSGVLDMIRIYEDAFAGFVHLGCDTEADAIAKAKQLHKEGHDDADQP